MRNLSKISVSGFWKWRVLIIQLFLSFLCTELIHAQSAQGNWDSRFLLPPGLNGHVNTTASDGTNLYVAGAFSKAGNVAAAGIAKWDGTNWFSLGTGVDGEVFAIAVNGDNVYVGGQFGNAGGVSATNVARWDGTNWNPLTLGVSSPSIVYALYASGTNLYVGGQFSFAGGLYATNIARWDGTAWHSMADGVYLTNGLYGPGGEVLTITGDGTNIYVGGIFVHAGNARATNLASWDGTAWHGMGAFTGGVNAFNPSGATVSAVTMHQGALVVGGDFQSVGSLPVQNLAAWNGSAWRDIGDADGVIKALDSFAGSLYVAGSFTSVGGVSATNMAVWTGGLWAAINSGLHVTETISSVQHFGSNIYLGG